MFLLVLRCNRAALVVATVLLRTEFEMSGFICFTQRKMILNLISMSRYTSHDPQRTLFIYRSVSQSINQSINHDGVSGINVT